jgi:hypothetical protein
MMLLGGCSALPECISLEVSKYWLFILLGINGHILSMVFNLVCCNLYYNVFLYDFQLCFNGMDFHKLI